MHSLARRRARAPRPFATAATRLGAAAVDELVGGRDPHDQVGMAQVRDQLVDGRPGPVDRRRRRRRGLPSVPR